MRERDQEREETAETRLKRKAHIILQGRSLDLVPVDSGSLWMKVGK